MIGSKKPLNTHYYTYTTVSPEMEDIEYEIEFSIESYGRQSNGWDDPGEGPEITIWGVTDVAHNECIQLFSLYGDWLELVEAKICESVFKGDYDDDGN